MNSTASFADRVAAFHAANAAIAAKTKYADYRVYRVEASGDAAFHNVQPCFVGLALGLQSAELAAQFSAEVEPHTGVLGEGLLEPLDAPELVVGALRRSVARLSAKGRRGLPQHEPRWRRSCYEALLGPRACASSAVAPGCVGACQLRREHERVLGAPRRSGEAVKPRPEVAVATGGRARALRAVVGGPSAPSATMVRTSILGTHISQTSGSSASHACRQKRQRTTLSVLVLGRRLNRDRRHRRQCLIQHALSETQGSGRNRCATMIII